MAEILISHSLGLGDLICLVLLACLWVRAGIIFLHANGSRPFIAFYLFIALVVTVSTVHGIRTDEMAWYPWARVLVVTGALITNEWALADDWRPWRWRP